MRNRHIARLRSFLGSVEFCFSFSPVYLLGLSFCWHDAGGDSGPIAMSLHVGPFAAYLSPRLPRALHRRRGDRELAVHLSWDSDGGGRGLHASWALWVDPYGYDVRGVARWRHSRIDLLNVVCGPVKYETRDVRTEQAVIRMPEGNYDVTVQLFDSTWSRKRFWRPDTVRRVSIDCPAGIDDGDKGPIWGSTFPAESISDGLSKFAADVVRRRHPFSTYEHRKPRVIEAA